jgi:hypothetical protein
MAPMTNEEQVHRRREESHLGQEDLRDAGDLDDVLRIPIHRYLSAGLHRLTSYAL